MTAAPKKALIFILDRSGSMDKIKSATIEDYNNNLAKMKETADLEYTLVQFDTIGTDTVHARIPIADVPDLTPETFQPRSGTPLIDACCITIDTAIDKYAQTDRVIITILTDGEENSSREYKMADLHDRIKTITGWGWQVIFLGANIDAYKDAGAAGIGVGNTMSYNAKDAGARRAAYGAVGQSVSDFYETGSLRSFTAEEKAAAGDTFHDKQPKPMATARHPLAAGGTAPTKTLVDKPKF